MDKFKFVIDSENNIHISGFTISPSRCFAWVVLTLAYTIWFLPLVYGWGESLIGRTTSFVGTILTADDIKAIVVSFGMYIGISLSSIAMLVYTFVMEKSMGFSRTTERIAVTATSLAGIVLMLGGTAHGLGMLFVMGLFCLTTFLVAFIICSFRRDFID